MRSEGPSATRSVAVAAGGLAVLVGGGHVVAWVAGLMPRGPTSAIIMKANAGLGLLASGLALMLVATRNQTRRRRRIAPPRGRPPRCLAHHDRQGSTAAGLRDAAERRAGRGRSRRAGGRAVSERADVTPASAAQRRLRVLVVDDNADLVAMLAVFVESFGHDVRKAFDGCTMTRRNRRDGVGRIKPGPVVPPSSRSVRCRPG